MEPDESVLKQYLLGELDDEQAAWVGRCLEENPALADTLESLARSDTFISLLRGAKAAPPDGPQVAAVIERLKKIPVAPKSADTTAPPQNTPPSDGDAPADGAERPTATPAGFPKLKGYRVLRLVGSGGMGMVFEAQDEKLNRRVALKVMKPEIAANSRARARFVREAKAVACIEHDNVVPIFHINEDDCPFLAMPFLKGEPLDKYVERSVYLPLPEILRIGRETALGLAAVHAQGLVHRDIKPGNLWLERFGDDRAWRVKVFDFGLARTNDEGDEAITQAGAVVGTPQFMAPEQARGARVDARADLFSLGATLYLLTTGRPPFGSGSVMSVLTALAVETPTPVRELNSAIPEALSDLIDSLLAKNPAGRPASAKAVAEALRVIEAGVQSPLVALPVGKGAAEPDEEWAAATSSERKRKAAKNLRRARLLAVAAVLLLLGGAFGAYKLVFETKYGTMTVQVDSPDIETRFSNNELLVIDKQTNQRYTLKLSERNKDLPVGDYRINVNGPGGLTLSTDDFKIVKGKDTVVHVTAKAPAKGPVVPPGPAAAPNPAPVPAPAAAPPAAPPIPVSPPSAELLALRRDQIPADVLAAVGQGDPNKAPEGLVGVLGVPKPMHRDALLGIAYSPNGRWLASASFDKSIILRDPETGVARRTLLGHTAGVFAVAFTKDSKTLVSASIDGTVRLWPVEADGKPEVIDTGLGPTVWVSMALSRDDKLLALGGDSGVIRLWKFGEWKTPADITDLEKKVALRTLAFSPDGKLLAAGGINSKDAVIDAFVFRTDTRKLDSSWATEGRGVLSVKFSRDGKKLVTGGGPGHPRGMARIWDLEAKKIVFDVQQFRDHAQALDLDPDAKRLIVCNGDDGLMLYDVAEQKPVNSLSGRFGNALRSVAFSPDGKSVAFGTHDGGLMVWDADLKRQRYLDRGPRHLVHSIAVAPDGSSVLLTTTENVLYRIALTDPRKPRFVTQFRKAPRLVALAPDGSKYAVAVSTYGWEGDALDIYDSATDKVLHALKPPGYVTTLSFTPDSTGLVVSGSSHAVVLYSAATGGELYRAPRKDPSESTHALAPDGKSVALCDRFTKRAVLLNLDTGNEIRSWETGQDVVPRACAYDPRGRFVAVGDWSNTIKLWDVQTGKAAQALAGHAANLTGLRFTADGESLVSAGKDGTLRVWNPDAARARAVIPVGPEGPAVVFALDRSGRYAFVAGSGGTVLVLKLPDGGPR